MCVCVYVCVRPCACERVRACGCACVFEICIGLKSFVVMALLYIIMED